MLKFISSGNPRSPHYIHGPRLVILERAQLRLEVLAGLLSLRDLGHQVVRLLTVLALLELCSQLC